MTNIFPCRLRFSKRGRERFLSHLDMVRLFTRAARRSLLPVRFSEGFTPRVMLSFPMALGVGLESIDEILDLELSEDVPPEKVMADLNAQLPAGVRILSAQRFPRAERTLVESIEYEVLEPPAPADFAQRAADLMARPDVVVHRERGEDSKPVDIRPFLSDLRVESGRIVLTLAVSDRGSARPHEVLQALGIPEARLLKRKTNLKKVRREGPDAD